MVIIAHMGIAVRELLKLTPNEANAPMLICEAPIREEALPAFREKGAIDNAEVLGAINPRELRYKNRRKTVFQRSKRLK